MVAVPDAPAAAAWYKQALGARELWNLGSVVGLEITGAPFFVGQPEKNGWESPANLGITTTRIEVFSDDPDAFIARAVAAGADGSVDRIRTHDMPWGPHRQGGFRDPFGHMWLVGDRSPLKAHLGAQPVHRWYTRPVLFVANVNRALGFYVGMLGFETRWHEGDGTGGVCQVNRGECEIILCEDATRRGQGRLFVELTADALADLRRELAERAVPTQETWWGSDAIGVKDPDGNELLFPMSG